MRNERYARYMFVPIILISIFTVVILRNVVVRVLPSENDNLSEIEEALLTEDSEKNESKSSKPKVKKLEKGEKVNINTADYEELLRLPGIGDKRAKDIIRYREDTGGFVLREQIRDIPGVGDAVYEELADKIEL